MAFADTYREQVVQSRQDRARKALFMSRIVGLMLMLLIGFVLRAEPDLRAALAEAGMNGIAKMTGRDVPTQTASAAPAESALPRDRVKVNRGSVPDAETASQSRVDAQAEAEELGQRLRTIKIGD